MNCTCIECYYLRLFEPICNEFCNGIYPTNKEHDCNAFEPTESHIKQNNLKVINRELVWKKKSIKL